MEYSLFALLIFFASLSARLDFKRRKIVKTKNTPFHARSGNKPVGGKNYVQTKTKLIVCKVCVKNKHSGFYPMLYPSNNYLHSGIVLFLKSLHLFCGFQHRLHCLFQCSFDDLLFFHVVCTKACVNDAPQPRDSTDSPDLPLSSAFEF